MKQKFEVRTDLVLEVRESFPGDGGEIPGVSLDEQYNKASDVKVSKVVILNESGAKAMGKSIGTYITLEAKHMSEDDEDYHREISEELANHIVSLLPSKKQLKILVVGLGNAEATPDSLGPKVLNNLQMTRHLMIEYGEEFGTRHHLPNISGIIPGVMAQTGMETFEILRGVVDKTKPDVLIAIDALAARSVRRLGTTIQLTDTGIHPGSGVGNHRTSLTKESLGVPVVAIGVPTVVGAAAIVHDTVATMVKTLHSSSTTSELGDFMENIDSQEQYDLIRELLEPEFGPMYVTPKDIDATVKQLSYTISEGIHIALHKEA